MTDAVERSDPKKPWDKKTVHLTRPMWIVGTRSARNCNPAAARRLAQLEAMKIPAKIDQQPAELVQWRKSWRDRRRMAWLTYQGFEAKFFWPAADLYWDVVTEYEAMGWFARHLFEIVQKQAIKQLDDQADGLKLTDRQTLIAEAVRLTMPGIWKYAMQGRRSIMVPTRAA